MKRPSYPYRLLIIALILCVIPIGATHLGGIYLGLKNGILLDQDFIKPQAFHKSAIARSGGLAGIISLNIFFIIYYLIYSRILIEFLFLSIFICSSVIIWACGDIKILFVLNPLSSRYFNSSKKDFTFTTQLGPIIDFIP